MSIINVVIGLTGADFFRHRKRFPAFWERFSNTTKNIANTINHMHWYFLKIQADIIFSRRDVEWLD